MDAADHRETGRGETAGIEVRRPKIGPRSQPFLRKGEGEGDRSRKPGRRSIRRPNLICHVLFDFLRRRALFDRQGRHEKTGFSPKAINTHENANPYPIRYPNNGDSVGIEVVGAYHEQTKTWDAPTTEQTASITKLVGILQREYGLDDHDIYKHDTISYKTQGEGDGLYLPDTAAGRMQQPAGPTR